MLEGCGRERRACCRDRSSVELQRDLLSRERGGVDVRKESMNKRKVGGGGYKRSAVGVWGVGGAVSERGQ